MAAFESGNLLLPVRIVRPYSVTPYYILLYNAELSVSKLITEVTGRICKANRIKRALFEFFIRIL
jgi:hypothetical protein